MIFIRSATLILLLLCIIENANTFSLFNGVKIHNNRRAFISHTNQLHMSTSTPPSSSSSSSSSSTNDFNAVHVAKTGGRGTVSTAQEAVDKNLSLGAPGDRPQGGHFLTKGGVQITAQVDDLMFVNAKNGEVAPEGSSDRAIEDLVDRLDEERGVLLSSSYEFPGR